MKTEDITVQLNRIESKLDRLLKVKGAKPPEDITNNLNANKLLIFKDCANKTIESWERLEANWNRFINETSELDVTKKDFKLMVENYERNKVKKEE